MDTTNIERRLYVKYVTLSYFKIVFVFVDLMYIVIESFTANQTLVDIVSSCVKDTVGLVLILDIIFYRAHCKSVEHITAGHCKF